MASEECLRNRLANNGALYEGNVSTMLEIREYLSQFEGGSVNLKFDNNIAIVTLDQPKKRNALSGTMMGELFDVVEKLESWQEGKGVILRGSKSNFCSGGDLDLARGTGGADGGFKMATFMANVLARFQTLPFVTVALIEGCGALGGGSELCVACDYRLADVSSQGIGFVHGRMGIIPAWGGTKRLVQVVGYRTALELLTTARVVSPKDALQIGLIDEIITPDTDPLEYAIQWLQTRTPSSANVIRGLKAAAQLALLSSSGDLELRVFAPYWGCDENKSAIASNIKHKAR